MYLQIGVRLRALSASAVLAVLGLSVTFVQPADATLVYGVTEQDVLVSWDSATPEVIENGFAISGLAQNETIQAIDFRPANGLLYALGSFSRLYTINAGTGQATLIGDGFAPPPLNGANFGFDFNPVVDLLRVTSDANQNFRLNPNSGEIFGTDTSLAYAGGDPNFGTDPNVVHSAYTNNFAGAATTTLFGIDTGLDVLVMQGGANGAPPSPNTGLLTTVGSLGIDVAEDGGFDIFTPSPTGNVAYAALRPTGSSVSNFYSINLGTGQATLIGEIGGGINIRAMTVIIPGPGALAIIAAGLLASRRRRR